MKLVSSAVIVCALAVLSGASLSRRPAWRTGVPQYGSGVKSMDSSSRNAHSVVSPRGDDRSISGLSSTMSRSTSSTVSSRYQEAQGTERELEADLLRPGFDSRVARAAIVQYYTIDSSRKIDLDNWCKYHDSKRQWAACRFHLLRQMVRGAVKGIGFDQTYQESKKLRSALMNNAKPLLDMLTSPSPPNH